MSKRKEKLQTIIFEIKFFPNRSKIRNWIYKNNYTYDKRKKQPIMKFEKTYRCRQKHPDWFKKKTFKKRKLAKGVFGVFGYMKR